MQEGLKGSNDRWIENTECDRKWVVADNGGNEARRKEKKGGVGGGGVSSSEKQRHDVQGREKRASMRDEA